MIDTSNTGFTMGVVTVANSFYVGGNWGFVLRENEDYERIVNILKTEPNSVKVQEVSNGSIVFVNPNGLYQVMSQVEQFDSNSYANTTKNRATVEMNELINLLRNILHGNCKYGIKTDDYEEYTIGVYSCNNTHKIRLNGIEYPAYSLTVKEVLKQLNLMLNHADVYVKTFQGFKNLKDIIAYNAIDSVNKGLEISTTMTGVFLTIRIVRK